MLAREHNTAATTYCYAALSHTASLRHTAHELAATQLQHSCNTRTFRKDSRATRAAITCMSRTCSVVPNHSPLFGRQVHASCFQYRTEYAECSNTPMSCGPRDFACVLLLQLAADCDSALDKAQKLEDLGVNVVRYLTRILLCTVVYCLRLTCQGHSVGKECF